VVSCFRKIFNAKITWQRHPGSGYLEGYFFKSAIQFTMTLIC
jgi:hypothetical protein